MARLRTGLAYIAVASVLVTAILVRYFDPFFVRAMRLAVFDYYQRLEPANYNPELPIRVVDIDEESLAKIGQWPWPRTTIAKLVQVLTTQGAAAIVFDVLFAEPDASSLEQIGKRLSATEAQLLARVVGNRPSNDDVFAAALKHSPSVLSVALGSGGSTVLLRKAGFVIAGDDPRSFVANFNTASTNLPELDRAAHGIGAYNWLADRDQIVRRIALVYSLGSALVPSLDAEALRVAQGASSYFIKAANASGETAFGRSTGINHIRIGKIEIPTDSAGGIYLKFRHFNKSAYLPAWKVLAGKIASQEITGRIILVGTSASGLLDLRATPLEAAVPGVDIHAQVLEDLLTGQLLTRPDYALAVEELVILVFGTMLGTVLPRVSAKYAAAIGLLTIGTIVASAWAAYRYANLLFDSSYPTLVLSMMTTGIAFYTYQAVEAQRGQIRMAFSRYLAPTVVQEIIRNPEKLRLGGEQRELTLMFCDVRNFTSIAENLTATEVTQFINELLTPLSEIILERRGTIDKYMGDAIMAFWNAPLDDPNHRANACSAAVEMIRKMDQLNERWRMTAELTRRSYKPVRIGIGLNSGDCCVGNLGSTTRFDYSAIGDEVNVTSRLEGLSKIYGVSAVVGGRALSPGIAKLELDMVQVKGRKRPERIYTFLELLDGDHDKLWRLEKAQSEFLMVYRQQKWNEADSLLSECRSMNIPGLETYYAIFASRINTMRQVPPSPDWDGSVEMLEK
jgi:adenylate cyclase